MISSSAVVLKHHRRTDGSFLIKIRITHQRKHSYIQTPYTVLKAQLDTEFKIKDRFVSLQLKEDELKISKEIEKNYRKLSTLPVKQIAEYLDSMLYGEQQDSLLYVPFAKEVIERKKAVGGSNWRNYELSLNRFLDFMRREDFGFIDITVFLLNQFNEFLEQEGVGPRGRKLYLSNIRAIFNEAKDCYNDEDRGVIRIPHNPFSKFKMPKTAETRKRALTIEEIRKIYNFTSTKEKEMFARDVFILSFFLVGMNTVDMYNANKLVDGRIIYNRSKTTRRRLDGAEISILIEDEIKDLVEKYRGLNHIFSFSDRYSSSDGFNGYINRYLKLVGAQLDIEHLEFYAARHSWATIFVNDCCGSESEAAFCLNHVSEYKTTSIYLKRDYTRIDVANRKVIDYLCKE